VRGDCKVRRWRASSFAEGKGAWSNSHPPAAWRSPAVCRSNRPPRGAAQKSESECAFAGPWRRELSMMARPSIGRPGSHPIHDDHIVGLTRPREKHAVAGHLPRRDPFVWAGPSCRPLDDELSDALVVFDQQGSSCGPPRSGGTARPAGRPGRRAASNRVGAFGVAF